jgi:RNA polymerase sigma-70 factor (sigma-E family)
MRSSERDRQVEAFLLSCGSDFMRTAMALTGSTADAQDLVQVTCLQVWRSWSRVESAQNPRAYCHTMLVNAHLTERRRRRWRREVPTATVPDSQGTNTDSGSAGSLESTEALRVLLADLPRQQRAAVVLRYVCDFDDAAIAAALGCSVSTVRSQISRAMARLRARPRELESPDGP